MRKKLLLIVVVAILAVSIPVTIVLIHQGQEPSNGGTADVPTDEPTDTPTNHSTLTMLSITEGDVFIMKAGTDSWIEAQVGMSLESGDIIKSGDSSSAEITFFDGSTIELEAGTEIEVVSLGISDTGSTTISLKQAIGSTISRVTKLVDSASSYEVETSACVAAVRGSSMLVQVIADGTTWVTNLEGEIWVTANGVELQIPEGRKCIIISGQSPQLVPSGGGGGGGSSPNLDIAITKMPSVPQAHEGNTIIYTYTVTNPGDVPLSNVLVTDDTIGNVPYQSGDTNEDEILGTDETWIFSANYTIPTGDANYLVNTASATGTYAGSRRIVAWTTATVDILRPAIAIDKTADREQAGEGDTINYTYTVTNTGNTPLSDVLVTDDTIEDVTYQNGDTNDDSKLDTNETWTFIANYIVSAEAPSSLINTATVYGTDALAQIVTAQATTSVDILPPAEVRVRFPDEGTAYIGYEDLPGFDFFDYNDFGMEMSVEEVYVNNCLTEINMHFESLIKDSVFDHDIHILRELSPSTSYNYTITRSTTTQGTETPAVTNAPGQGDFDKILFDTSHFTPGATVTIHIEITAGCEPYVATPEPPRWDLASIWAYYDPYMNYRYIIPIEHHIEDWQPAVVPRLPTDGYDVPYILVIPVTGWEVPPEGTSITVLYPDFDDYYDSKEWPADWYK
jgi:uncharacterized repeat protein (TIGR01451 family)